MNLASHELLKLSVVDHLLDNVEATHELSFDNELWKRRPVIVGLETWLLQNVGIGI